MSEEVVLKIDGMHCDACVRRVRMALGKVQGANVKDVQVGSARVELEPAQADAAIRAVNDIGFTAQRG
jgi:copper chaperone